LHMNEDELVLLTGCNILDTKDSEDEDEFTIAKAADLFLQCGVAIVAVTRGRKGSYVACNTAERFGQTPALPSSWANCSVHMPATALPEGTQLNTNGAGDAYTSGLLVASMLRHTGKVITSNLNKSTESQTETSDRKDNSAVSTANSMKIGGSSSTGKKMTPYALYMRENFVTLKQQCKNDKKAIFAMCHEMWENESEEVKAMYARMVKEEYDDVAATNEASSSILSDTSMEVLESNLSSKDYAGVEFQTEHTANASLNLQSAVQLAGLIAARHVDVSTRDLDHLDLSELIQKSIISLSPVVSNEI